MTHGLYRTGRALVGLRRASAVAMRRPLCTASVYPPPRELVPAENMSAALRRRVASLEGLHARFEQMEEEHHERLKEIEVSYLEQTRNLFQRRQKIVSGAEEPTEEEVAASSYFTALMETEAEGVVEGVEEVDADGVPAFWSTVFRNNPTLQEFDDFTMGEADLAVLEYLEEVSQDVWEDEESQVTPEGWDGELGGDPGFSLHFRFAPNPYLLSNELVLYCNGEFEVIKATEPEWREERVNPTIKMVTKKVKKKGSEAQKRQVAKPAESFFRIFQTPAEEDDLDWDDESQGTPPALADGLVPVRQLQSEFVMRLREDVIPRAQIYYIGALQGADWEMDDEWNDDGEWDEGPDPTPKGAGGRR